MASDGSIVIDTRINTKGFQKGAVDIQAQFSKIANAAKKLGVILGGVFAVREIIQFGKEAIELGSDLQEVQNVVDVTFGSLNTVINDFSKNAITQFGLSELSAKQYASTIGAMLKSMGLATDQAAEMSMQITGLAGDMASFYNLSGDEAFAKIRSGISGETEPLKQLGINLSVANLEQFAFAQGISKTYDAMTEQEKAMLRYNYLLSVTADAQGDFARTSGSWANQTKILSEQFNSLKASIGQGLINAFTPVIKIINTTLAGLQAVGNAFRQITALLFGNAGGASAQIESVAAGFDSAADSASNLADATEKAGKAAKKYLAGFDEITKASDSKETGGGSSIMQGFPSGAVSFGNNMPVEDAISPQIQAIVEKCLALIAPLRDIDFAPLMSNIGRLGGAFFELGEIISDSLEWVWFNILVPFSKWTIEKAAPGVVGLLADAFALLSDVLSPVLDGLEKLLDYLQPVFDFIGDTAIEVLEWFQELFQKLSRVFEEKGPKISGIFSNIGEVISQIWWNIEPTLIDFRDLVGKVFDFVSNIVADAVDDVFDVLHGLTEFIAGVFSGDWDRAFAGIIEIVNGFIDFFFSALEDIFGFFGLEFDFEAIKNGFKTVVNSVIGFLNKLISGIVSGINTAIKAINKLSVTIPNWIPGIGGSKFGFNIKTITAPQIPYLAKGAVIPPNAPFMAMLGDQKHGTNVEAPLSTIQEAVALVMEDFAASNIAGQEAIVGVLREILEAVLGIEIDGETLSRAVNEYQRKRNVVTGGT